MGVGLKPWGKRSFLKGGLAAKCPFPKETGWERVWPHGGSAGRGTKARCGHKVGAGRGTQARLQGKGLPPRGGKPEAFPVCEAWLPWVKNPLCPVLCRNPMEALSQQTQRADRSDLCRSWPRRHLQAAVHKPKADLRWTPAEGSSLRSQGDNGSLRAKARAAGFPAFVREQVARPVGNQRRFTQALGQGV
jgi:hypothetical protein